MAPSQPLEADLLPNPFAHERGEHGRAASLRWRLWEALRHEPQGLSLSEVVQRLKTSGHGESPEDGQVEATLRAQIHFHELDESRWVLTIYRPLRWGVAGVGQIAQDFISVATLLPGVQLVAAASGHNADKAREFAEAHGAKKSYGSYEELAKDPDMDIVYVANTHPQHLETTTLMLEHGKHVLCEKPIAVNAKDTKAMLELAANKKLFLTEGLWTRFLPAMLKAQAVVQEGLLGRVHFVQSHIAVHMPEDEVERLYDIKQGGGGLLDIGVYPLSIASAVYGGEAPGSVNAMALTADTGADTAGTVNLRYGELGLANIFYSINMDMPIEGHIFGDKGHLHIHHRAQCPTKISVHLQDSKDGGEPEVFEYPPPPKPGSINHGDVEGGFNFHGSIGFIYEAMAVHCGVLSGSLELPQISHKETVTMMEVCDQIRVQLGVAYPQDSFVHKLAAGADLTT